MRKITVFMLGAAFAVLGLAATANAASTEVTSSDGTKTTVIVPTGPDSAAVVTPKTATETEVVIKPRPAVDAISGEPVSNTTARPKKEKESLRDKVRDKME